MAIKFYPVEGEITNTTTIEERLEILLESAENFKAAVLDTRLNNVPGVTASNGQPKKRMIPRDMGVAFNWEEIAKLLRDLRDLPESSHAFKLRKANFIIKLAEIYEVLRAAKMPKLEAVRIALTNEANQLRRGNSDRTAS